MNSNSNKYREASHAGSWYSSNKNTLDGQLTGWLSNVTNGAGDMGSNARAIIAPHAGFSYSGPTAAYAYKQIDPSMVNKVFILGPSHHVHLKGCALTATSICHTPLYDLIVDRPITEKLHATGCFDWMTQQTDEDEHSIEMHLPYVAKVMQQKRDKYTVVPVLVGNLSKASERLYGELFAPYLADPSNLFVISSDFCHWGKRFSYSDYEESNGTIAEHIEKLDRMGMELIERLDTLGFHNYLRDHRNTICGRHPISVLLNMIDVLKSESGYGKPIGFKFIHYAQSNACRSKNDSSVSYASGVLTIS
ncbi:protein MEMO1-like [Watersipora subatra]|uniref:protein MEMO1-like n=1 Tax=Watersipora subatra TaxID=2589382 RepID=UPI00355B8699